jgi:muramoyltetrapeptide carboxypeptidase
MRIIKPKALKKNDVIGICAPASPVKSITSLSKGVGYLESLGYRVKIGKNVSLEYGYLAGKDDQRAKDFNELVYDKKVKAIFFLRGGYGSLRILPFINYDELKRNPKIIVGYSDLTALQLAIFKNTGLATFCGPMIATDFSKIFSGYAEELFWKMLTYKKPLGSLAKNLFHRTHVVKKGTASGRILGGNLSMVSSMIGNKNLPSFANAILLLEEVGEAPYRIDRMLHQLKYAGVLENLSGVLLGDFSTCKPEREKPSLSVQEIFNQIFKSYPALSDVHFGHIKNPITFPLGLNLKIDIGKQEISILESTVI